MTLFKKRCAFFCFFAGFFLQSLANIEACGEDEESPACNARQYGHRRAFVHEAKIHLTDFQSYFQQHAKIAQELRQKLIVSGAFQRVSQDAELQKARDLFLKNPMFLFLEKSEIAKAISEHTKGPGKTFSRSQKDKNGKILEYCEKIKTEVNSREHNIASFGFVFFDEKDNLINQIPFYFSNSSQNDLEASFFFLSGRSQRDYDAEVDGLFSWSTLEKDAPTQSDLVEIKKAKEILVSYGRKKHGKELSNYHNAITTTLLQKTQEYPFFDYLKRRHLYASGLTMQEENEELCSDFIQVLAPPVYCLQDPQSDRKRFYPDHEEDVKNKEGDFTHSEQYALFQAAETEYFNEFLRASQKKLITLQASVRSYAVLVYSYNVMCVRCAQSTIFDFQHQENPLNLRINMMLNNLEQKNIPNAQRPMGFLAGYNRLYSSNIYPSQPLDAFEGFIGTRLRDQTLGENVGHNKCDLDLIPQVIYHYKIPTELYTERVSEAGGLELPFKQEMQDIEELPGMQDNPVDLP